MHILLIHQAFASHNEPGGTRHYELARRWVAEGHRFTVIASNLSYLTGQRTFDPSLMEKQILKDLRVRRAYTFFPPQQSFFWRVVSFISFMFTSIWGALGAGPVDLVMGTSPPIFQPVSAWLVAVLRHRPFLLEIRDLWPDFAIDMGILKNPSLIVLSRWLERFLYARATHLLVNSPAYREYLISKGEPPRKISLIPNGVDPNMFCPEARGECSRKKWELGGKFVVTYAGALGVANDIPTVLRAAARLLSQKQIRFLFVGDGKDRPSLEAMAAQLSLTNVTFTGSWPKTELPEILAASDACIASLKNIPMFRTTYPNKVFDYMAAGRPTILAIDGVIRHVIEASVGGVFVPPGDDFALAEAIFNLSRDRQRAQEMGRAARDYVTKHFNRCQHAVEFIELVQRITRPSSSKVRRPPYRAICKRSLDLITTLLVLPLLTPLFVIVSLLVRLQLGSPIIFRQLRPGLNGKPFVCYKFCTMTDARDSDGNLLPDTERLTSVGRFLRSTSLDELPELFNVLKGDMSLVGPRPLLMQYLDRYTPEQARRHEVNPGITGWAQVNGRNALTWEEKFKLDVWYVDNQSFWLDLKILALTVWKILKREGVNQPGQATAAEFNPQIRPIDTDS